MIEPLPMTSEDAVMRVRCHYPGMPVPGKGHASDAGIDLTAMAYERKHGVVFFFDAGISLQISPGFYVEVAPRSSIVKSEFIMANSLGVIDPDYRGRVFVPLRYVGKGSPDDACRALIGKRIAQMLVRRYQPCRIEIVEKLDETLRGEGGFGSTG